MLSAFLKLPKILHCFFFCCLADKRKLKCPVNFFACPSGRCIPMSWTCDKENDCENGADETHCGQSATKLSSNTLFFFFSWKHKACQQNQTVFLEVSHCTWKNMTYGLGKLNNFSKTLSSLFPTFQTNFVHPPSSNVGTTAAFPPTGCVTALMTVVTVLMRTRNAVSDILLTNVKVLSPTPNAGIWLCALRFPDVLSSCNFPIMSSQNPRPAVLRLSSVPAPTCACLNAGSVMETRTVLMELMRASRLAAVSGAILWLKKKKTKQKTLQHSSINHSVFFSTSSVHQQHLWCREWVHVPEQTVYPQALCVRSWHRLLRWLRWIPRMWWVCVTVILEENCRKKIGCERMWLFVLYHQLR